MKLTFLKTQGFTLTEIMVTLAIVLIITLMAIPTMNNYIIQSKVSDAVQAATSIQNLVNSKIAANESVTGSGTGLNLPTSLGRYVQTFNVDSNGVVSITTTPSASSISLTLTPAFSAANQEISWTCAVTDVAFNPSVPDECRI